MGKENMKRAVNDEKETQLTMYCAGSATEIARIDVRSIMDVM